MFTEIIFTDQELLEALSNECKEFDFSEHIECKNEEIELEFEHEGEILAIIAKVDKDMDYREIPSTYLQPKEINVLRNDIDIHSIELYGEEGLIELSDSQKAIIEADLLKRINS